MDRANGCGNGRVGPVVSTIPGLFFSQKQTTIYSDFPLKTHHHIMWYVRVYVRLFVYVVVCECPTIVWFTCLRNAPIEKTCFRFSNKNVSFKKSIVCLPNPPRLKQSMFGVYKCAMHFFVNYKV